MKKILVAAFIGMLTTSAFAQTEYDPTADKALITKLDGQVKVENAALNLLKTQLKVNKNDADTQHKYYDCQARIQTYKDSKKTVEEAIDAQAKAAKLQRSYQDMNADLDKANAKATEAVDKATEAAKKAEAKATEAQQKADEAKNKANEATRKIDEVKKSFESKTAEVKKKVDDAKAKADEAQQTANEAKSKLESIRNMMR